MGTTAEGAAATGLRGGTAVDRGSPLPCTAEANAPGAEDPVVAAMAPGVVLWEGSSDDVELDAETKSRHCGKRKSSIRFTTSDQEVPHNATAGMATTHANMINARPATAADDRMTSHASLRAQQYPTRHQRRWDDSPAHVFGQDRLQFAHAVGCIPHFAFGTRFRRNRILVLVDGGWFLEDGEARQWNAL
jgi:hypothetical protein